MEARDIFRDAIENIMDLVFPPDIYCICCEKPIEHNKKYSLCDECYEKVYELEGKRKCIKCGKLLSVVYSSELCSNCMVRLPLYERAISVCRYDDVGGKIIHNYKTKKNSYMHRFIGAMLVKKLRDELVNDKDGYYFDGIIAVPIHKKKEQERGFNQSELLAQYIYGEMKTDEIFKDKKRVYDSEKNKKNLRYFKDGLVKNIETKPLKSLDESERRTHIKNTINVRDPLIIKGRSLLLIDDILTTGSTFDECSKVLLDSGAKKVVAISFTATINKN